tara:strand:- start:3611 stop:3838 length:228 start_codon:yes stop_codon:yes gene_type:complete
MAIFEPQKIYCPICATEFFTSFNMKLCCSMECVQELNWRRTLYTMGKKYYIDPKSKHAQEEPSKAPHHEPDYYHQ